MGYPPEQFIQNISLLCGRDFGSSIKRKAIERLERALSDRTEDDLFSARQLNEALLLLNERIATEEFFDFLASGRRSPVVVENQHRIKFGDFEDRVREFRKLAMLRFGSFRFAYNFLSQRDDVRKQIGAWLDDSDALEETYRQRSKPLCDVDKIPLEKLYILGHVSGEDAPSDEKDKYRSIGKSNFDTYLTWDYMDVYVATSMREDWEFRDVHRLCEEVFLDKRLRGMRVRHFDPTLSFDHDPISKGLIEGLMLKRAKCTLYLAQESDTMGKDSELAATLAQGKPVIAYVPTIDVVKRACELAEVILEELLYRADKLQDLVEGEDLGDFNDCSSKLAKIAAESEGKEQEKALLSQDQDSFDRLIELVARYEKVFYDRRASLLERKHPLRFQLDLSTGVANGLLVARAPDAVSDLIYRILTNKLDFRIVEPGETIADDGEKPDDNFLLVETSTNCAFRVVTHDEKLTNSFWSLYKKKEL